MEKDRESPEVKKETIPPLKIEMPSESREEKEERKRREKASSLEIFIALKNQVKPP